MAVAWAVSFSKAQVIPHCNRLCHPPTTSGHPAVFHIKYKYKATQVLDTHKKIQVQYKHKSFLIVIVFDTHQMMYLKGLSGYKLDKFLVSVKFR